MKQVADWQLSHPEGSPGDWANAAFHTGLTAAYPHRLARRVISTSWGRSGRDWRGSRARDTGTRTIMRSRRPIPRALRFRKEPEMMIPFRETVNRMMALPPDWEEIHQPIDYWWSDSRPRRRRRWLAWRRRRVRRSILDFMDGLPPAEEPHELLWDLNSQLFYPTPRFRHEAPGEFWSRGNAWVLSGLALMLEEGRTGRRGSCNFRCSRRRCRCRQSNRRMGCGERACRRSGSRCQGEGSLTGASFAMRWPGAFGTERSTVTGTCRWLGRRGQGLLQQFTGGRPRRLGAKAQRLPSASQKAGTRRPTGRGVPAGRVRSWPSSQTTDGLRIRCRAPWLWL